MPPPLRAPRTPARRRWCGSGCLVAVGECRVLGVECRVSGVGFRKARDASPPPCTADACEARVVWLRASSSSSLLLSSLELSDTKVSAIQIRALIGIASHFCEVIDEGVWWRVAGVWCRVSDFGCMIECQVSGARFSVGFRVRVGFRVQGFEKPGACAVEACEAAGATPRLVLLLRCICRERSLFPFPGSLVSTFLRRCTCKKVGLFFEGLAQGSLLAALHQTGPL